MGGKHQLRTEIIMRKNAFRMCDWMPLRNEVHMFIEPITMHVSEESPLSSPSARHPDTDEFIKITILTI